MRKFDRLLVSATFAYFFAATAGFAQSPTISQQAKAAFTSQLTISNVTLDGTFVSVEGSLQQNGNAHLVVGSDGTYSVSLTKSSGAAGEARSETDAGVSCTWMDPGGISHPVDSFNCQTPAWFLPELPVLLSSEANPEWTLSAQTDVGSSPHLQFAYNGPDTGGQSQSPGIALDLELSSATLLPNKASFCLHPDGQNYTNIPVQIIYQNYQRVNGVAIPFRIQRFVNGTLVLDITISSASVN